MPVTHGWIPTLILSLLASAPSRKAVEPTVSLTAPVDLKAETLRVDAGGTETLFTEVDTTYRARGFTHGEILGIDVELLGANSALATVQWAYMGACEELLWKTTFSYNLFRRDGAWKILVQTMHDS